jgi:hypothetical protein
MGKITGFLEIEHHDRNYARAGVLRPGSNRVACRSLSLLRLGEGAGRIEGASFTPLQVGAMAYRPADRARQCGLGIWIFPDADECELVRRFTQLPIPIPGFSSSDCAKCRSYLLE